MNGKTYWDDDDDDYGDAMLMILKVLQIGCLRDSVHDGFTLTCGAQEGKAWYTLLTKYVER